jgi:hypothetical protein
MSKVLGVKHKTINIMKAKVFWPNGHISIMMAYFNEALETFKHRVLKAYGSYDVSIMLCSSGNEGYYIK